MNEGRRRLLSLSLKTAGFLALTAANVSCFGETTKEKPRTIEPRKLPITLTPDGKTSIKYGTIKNATKMTVIVNREIMDRMCEDSKYKDLQIGVGRNIGVSVIFEPGSLEQVTRPMDSLELASLKRIHKTEQGFDITLAGIGYRVDNAFSRVLARSVPKSFRNRALAEELSIGWVASMIRGVDVSYGVSENVTFTQQQLSLITASAVLPIDVVQVPQEYWDKAGFNS